MSHSAEQNLVPQDSILKCDALTSPLKFTADI